MRRARNCVPSDLGPGVARRWRGREIRRLPSPGSGAARPNFPARGLISLTLLARPSQHDIRPLRRSEATSDPGDTNDCVSDKPWYIEDGTNQWRAYLLSTTNRPVQGYWQRSWLAMDIRCARQRAGMKRSMSASYF